MRQVDRGAALASASRRGFLKGMLGTSGLAAIGAGSTAAILNTFAARPARSAVSPDYGALSPIEDEATGLPLLQLPQGFRYISYGWTGDLMKDDRPTPRAHDGMAVVSQRGNNLVLVRIHEIRAVTPSFGKKGITYDPVSGGGTTNLVFNTATVSSSRVGRVSPARLPTARAVQHRGDPG